MFQFLNLIQEKRPFKGTINYPTRRLSVTLKVKPALKLSLRGYLWHKAIRAPSLWEYKCRRGSQSEIQSSHPARITHRPAMLRKALTARSPRKDVTGCEELAKTQAGDKGGSWDQELSAVKSCLVKSQCHDYGPFQGFRYDL
jgi:hypothetical protein